MESMRRDLPNAVRTALRRWHTGQQEDLPWREMAQMRDKLIHHYFGVSLEVVWKTATQQLPALSLQIRDVLTDMRADDQ